MHIVLHAPDGPSNKCPYDLNGVKLCISHHSHDTGSDELSPNQNALLEAGMGVMWENLNQKKGKTLTADKKIALKEKQPNWPRVMFIDSIILTP